MKLIHDVITVETKLYLCRTSSKLTNTSLRAAAK